MKKVSVTHLLGAAALALSGFFLAILGISRTSDASFVDALAATISEDEAPILATATCADTTQSNEEIFFLSCGGIY